MFIVFFFSGGGIVGGDTKCQERARGPTVWLRLAGGGGRAAIGLWGGTGGCCGPFPERGRSVKRKHITGECGPRSGSSRNRSCTQCRVSWASRTLDPADFRQHQREHRRQVFVCAWVTAAGGWRQCTPGHTQLPGREKLALRAHRDPAGGGGAQGGALLPLTNALGGPASSYFLLLLISSLKGRSRFPTPVTKSQTGAGSLRLAQDSHSHFSDHPEVSLRQVYWLTMSPPLRQGKARTASAEFRPPYILCPGCLSRGIACPWRMGLRARLSQVQSHPIPPTWPSLQCSHTPCSQEPQDLCTAIPPAQNALLCACTHPPHLALGLLIL